MENPLVVDFNKLSG